MGAPESCYPEPWKGKSKAEFSHRAKRDKQGTTRVERNIWVKKGQSRKSWKLWVLMLQGSATRGKCKIREKGTSPSAAVPPVQTSETFVMGCIWLFWKLGTGQERKATGKEQQSEHFIFEFPFSKWRNRKDLCYINPDKTLNGCRDVLTGKSKALWVTK